METPEEMKERLKELGSKKGYIDGIFNYCDRWCERCKFTSKCRNYAFGPEDQNLSWEDTFKYVSNVLKATMLMIEEDANNMGIDLSKIEDNDFKEEPEPFQDKLSKFANETALEINKWFEETDEKTGIKNYDAIKHKKNLSPEYYDAFEVILWYHLFFSVKLERAIHSASDDDFEEFARNDSNGSAKITLIALDRSVAAWSIIMDARPEFEEKILEFLIRLSKIRKVTEERFPEARSYIRPGLDE